MEFTDPESQETDSDEFDELENELYSVLHYNILSENIPSYISDKYDIKRNEKDEFLISLKKIKQDSEEILPVEPILSEQKDVSHDIDSSQNFITISDDSDSDVILNEPTLDVTYVSSPSVVEASDSISDIDMGDDMVLNIDGKAELSSVFPTDDSEEETIKVKWKEVTSPCSWTNDMKKYYNKPCERLKNFDYEKIREEMKGSGDWHIILADKLPSKRKVRRCTICRKTDHQRKNCPRRFVNCYMCGNSGHNDTGCPEKKCLNCGRRNKVYVAMCNRCLDGRFQTCSECQQKGHTKDNCPDTWRRYHATTKGELVVKEESANQRLWCCNCAQSGHLFENCPKLFWSVYPPVSCLIKKSEEFECKSAKGKRSRGLEENTFDFNRTPKKPKRNHTFFDRSPNVPNWNNSLPSAPINRISTGYNHQTPPFHQNHASFNRNYTPFNQNPPPFNRNSTPINQRSPPNKRFTPFNQRSTPLHKRTTLLNQSSTPFNEASTSFKRSNSQTPKRNKKNRYFQWNDFDRNVNFVKHPHNQMSPKKKKRKNKNKKVLHQ